MLDVRDFIPGTVLPLHGGAPSRVLGLVLFQVVLDPPGLGLAGSVDAL